MKTDKKFVYVLNNFKIDKVAHKNNPWTYLTQQNKKSLLMTAAFSNSRKVTKTIKC